MWIRREPSDGSGLFRLDETRYATEAPGGGVRLASVDFPDRFLRH